jgi:hypothetical protein
MTLLLLHAEVLLLRQVVRELLHGAAAVDMGDMAGPAAAAAVGLRPRVVVAVGVARADDVWLPAAAAMRLLPAAAEECVGTVPGTVMTGPTSLRAG